MTVLPVEPGPVERVEVEALRRRIAALFLECETNPYAGDLMGAGRHPELADCSQAIKRGDELQALGWPNLAADVREGLPAEDALRRLLPASGPTHSPEY